MKWTPHINVTVKNRQGNPKTTSELFAKFHRHHFKTQLDRGEPDRVPASAVAVSSGEFPSALNTDTRYSEASGFGRTVVDLQRQQFPDVAGHHPERAQQKTMAATTSGWRKGSCGIRGRFFWSISGTFKMSRKRLSFARKDQKARRSIEHVVPEFDCFRA